MNFIARNFETTSEAISGDNAVLYLHIGVRIVVGAVAITLIASVLSTFLWTWLAWVLAFFLGDAASCVIAATFTANCGKAVVSFARGLFAKGAAA